MYVQCSECINSQVNIRNCSSLSSHSAATNYFFSLSLRISSPTFQIFHGSLSLNPTSAERRGERVPPFRPRRRSEEARGGIWASEAWVLPCARARRRRGEDDLRGTECLLAHGARLLRSLCGPGAGLVRGHAADWDSRQRYKA